MSNVTHYDIARAGTADELAKKVSAKLAEGWQPHGALVVVQKPTSESYCQALVKTGDTQQ